MVYINQERLNMATKEEPVKELLKQCNSPEEILGENGLLKQLTKMVLEGAMEGELTHHLGYEKHNPKGNNSGNSRNGKSKKSVKGDFGEIEVNTPRDRNGTFEPQILKKGQTRFEGFDDKIISMYSRGMTTRDIQAHLHEICNIEVSADFVSEVTNAVWEKVQEWNNRPLDEVYPIVYLDCLTAKVRDEGRIARKSVYLAIGINLEGHKEALGMWIEQTEGAKFWLRVINELKNRGVEDIFIACVDGLKGFPEAINAVFPKTDIQLCIVHMVRNSLRFVPWKNKKEVVADLKRVYGAVNAEEASRALDDFSGKWDARYPLISKSWRNNWDNIIPFFAYPNYIRKAFYTTNAIESLNMTLRKVLKNRSSFPNDKALQKLLYLSLERIARKWTMPIRDWGSAINQFSIAFEGRVPV